jgi:hypothetical protein
MCFYAIAVGLLVCCIDCHTGGMQLRQQFLCPAPLLRIFVNLFLQLT